MFVYVASLIFSSPLPPNPPPQGFKHKVFLVQVASYASWKVLINNFSIDMELLTQQRRLKLLLMPLLASAVKDRHEQVEVARLQTWWHLIRKLGLYREPLFHQVHVHVHVQCTVCTIHVHELLLLYNVRAYTVYTACR